MFINNKKVGIGSIVKNNTVIHKKEGYFEINSNLTVTFVGDRGYDVKDENGNEISEAGWDFELVAEFLDEPEEAQTFELKEVTAKVKELLQVAIEQAEVCKYVPYDEGFYIGQEVAYGVALELLGNIKL